MIGLQTVPEEAPSERALIEGASNEVEAFRTLYRDYFPRVFAYVAYRVGGQQDAEDVVAEVFARVVETLDRFEYRGEGAFAAWLFRIAHNQVAQFHRERRHSVEALALDELPEIRAETSTPDEALIRKERFARLHRHIATLSPRRAEIVTLRFFGHLRNREIADILGLDERTVASHLTRALEDLQRRYAATPTEERNL